MLINSIKVKQSLKRMKLKVKKPFPILDRYFNRGIDAAIKIIKIYEQLIEREINL